MGRDKEKSSEKAKGKTVNLTKKQVGYLRSVSNDIFNKTGENVDRSKIVRGILDGIAQSKLDFSNARTEEEIKDKVRTSINFRVPRQDQG